MCFTLKKNNYYYTPIAFLTFTSEKSIDNNCNRICNHPPEFVVFDITKKYNCLVIKILFNWPVEIKLLIKSNNDDNLSFIFYNIYYSEFRFM